MLGEEWAGKKRVRAKCLRARGGGEEKIWGGKGDQKKGHFFRGIPFLYKDKVGALTFFNRLGGKTVYFFSRIIVSQRFCF